MGYLMKKSMDPNQGTSDSVKDEAKEREERYTPPHARNQNEGQMNQNHGQLNLQANNHMVKLKFLEFNGENPQNRIAKANRFFQIRHMGKIAKMYHSCYYMMDSADVWYMEYVEGKEGIDWNELCEMLMRRFLRPEKEDVVIEFTKLQQFGDVNTYPEMFD